MPLTRAVALRLAAFGALLLMPGLHGCRTRLLVEDISQGPTGHAIDGIPFRVKETHIVRVFQWVEEDAKTGKGHFKEVFNRRMPFANLDKVFALNYRAEAFTNSKLTLNYQADNTIKDVTMTGMPTSAGFEELGKQAVALADKMAKVEDDIQARADAVRERERTAHDKELLKYQDVHAYNAAMQALKDACAAYKKDKGDATKEPAARSAVVNAMVAVNEKSIKLGYGTPYPNPYAVDLGVLCQ